MKKLVFGVGVNDLPYRTQVYEYVTKDGGTDWPAVEDQKADKKAVAEIVKLRRELKYLSAVVETNNMEIKVLQLEVKLLSDKEKENRWFLVKDGY